ncbi:Ger(x)C family spore germination protein [Bacillus sp. FJAT-47783]|uniref:Ger(x)C family spore germination protein n=1 Tax=Bacillus sp. FJAT-47783 TaxID=2922712 RepID=UPI001FAD84DF|nr:Ger(x)C family spore germination protein [Bacillus sp. FJAT-47783]
MNKFFGVIIVLIVLTGCWNRKEIETLGFVLAAGIDQMEDKYVVSTQVANTEVLAKDVAGGEKSYFTYKSIGQSEFDAIRNVTNVGPNRLFWSHTKVLVISEDVAKKGIKPALEFFTRDAEERRNFLIVITPLRAEKIIEANVKTKKLPAISLFDQLELEKATSKRVTINLNEFFRKYHTTESAMIPTVTIVTNQGEVNGVSFKMGDTAIFKKDKLVGYFSPNEIRGVLWVKEDVKSAIVVTDCPKKTNELERISFETFQNKSDVTVVKKNDNFEFHIKVIEKGNLAEAPCVSGETNPKVIKDLEKIKKEKIKSEILTALEKAQKMKVDVFGFGELVHRTYPKEWKHIEKEWDEIFSNITVNIEIESTITGNALIQRKK